MKCRECDKDLGFYCQSVRDVDCSRVKGLYCEECAETKLSELKKGRFVEEYKGNQIYVKDGGYYPYWECPYYFENIEGARARIDQPYIAIVDMNAFRFISRTLNE